MGQRVWIEQRRAMHFQLLQDSGGRSGGVAVAGLPDDKGKEEHQANPQERSCPGKNPRQNVLDVILGCAGLILGHIRDPVASDEERLLARGARGSVVMPLLEPGGCSSIGTGA